MLGMPDFMNRCNSSMPGRLLSMLLSGEITSNIPEYAAAAIPVMTAAANNDLLILSSEAEESWRVFFKAAKGLWLVCDRVKAELKNMLFCSLLIEVGV